VGAGAAGLPAKPSAIFASRFCRPTDSDGPATAAAFGMLGAAASLTLAAYRVAITAFPPVPESEPAMVRVGPIAPATKSKTDRRAASACSPVRGGLRGASTIAGNGMVEWRRRPRHGRGGSARKIEGEARGRWGMGCSTLGKQAGSWEDWHARRVSERRNRPRSVFSLRGKKRGRICFGGGCTPPKARPMPIFQPGVRLGRFKMCARNALRATIIAALKVVNKTKLGW
jgi:hypothetical protein